MQPICKYFLDHSSLFCPSSLTANTTIRESVHNVWVTCGKGSSALPRITAWASPLCKVAWRGVLSPKSPLILGNTVKSHINLDERRATIQNLIHCLIKIFLYLSPMSNYQNVNPITWLRRGSNEERNNVFWQNLIFSTSGPFPRRQKYDHGLLSQIELPQEKSWH